MIVVTLFIYFLRPMFANINYGTSLYSDSAHSAFYCLHRLTSFNLLLAFFTLYIVHGAQCDS